MKLITICISALLFAFFLSLPLDAGAQTPPPYQPLAPLPGIDSSMGVANYFSTIYQIGISIVLVIAVVMLVYGGIQYMTSDSIGGKGNGRETVAKAIIGIVLAVTSYALLYVIGGSGSVSVGFDIPSIEFGALESEDPFDSITVSPDELMRDPNEVDTPPTPVATKTVDHPEIEMGLYEVEKLSGGSTLNYYTTWPTVEENATLRLELYYETNPGSNDFTQLVRTIELGDIGPDGEGTMEVGSVEVDAGILANPIIARLKVYDSSGRLLEEHLFGFNDIPVSNEMSQ
jgi:hypothetical protein